jgi:hypothetical protein
MQKKGKAAVVPIALVIPNFLLLLHFGIIGAAGNTAVQA